MKTIKIEHVCDNKVSVFNTEQEFINFTKTIIDENFDTDNFIVRNVQECKNYINNFCDNLKIRIDMNI